MFLAVVLVLIENYLMWTWLLKTASVGLLKTEMQSLHARPAIWKGMDNLLALPNLEGWEKVANDNIPSYIRKIEKLRW